MADKNNQFDTDSDFDSRLKKILENISAGNSYDLRNLSDEELKKLESLVQNESNDIDSSIRDLSKRMFTADDLRGTRDLLMANPIAADHKDKISYIVDKYCLFLREDTKKNINAAKKMLADLELKLDSNNDDFKNDPPSFSHNLHALSECLNEVLLETIAPLYVTLGFRIENEKNSIKFVKKLNDKREYNKDFEAFRNDPAYTNLKNLKTQLDDLLSSVSAVNREYYNEPPIKLAELAHEYNSLEKQAATIELSNIKGTYLKGIFEDGKVSSYDGILGQLNYNLNNYESVSSDCKYCIKSIEKLSNTSKKLKSKVDPLNEVHIRLKIALNKIDSLKTIKNAKQKQKANNTYSTDQASTSNTITVANNKQNPFSKNSQTPTTKRSRLS